MLNPLDLVVRAANLAVNTSIAAAVPWGQHARSIFGDLSSYRDVPRGYETELAVVYPPTLAGLGSLASAVISVPVVGRRLRQDSGPIPVASAYDGAHPSQRWFFINGISADLRISTHCVTMLSKAFRRPVTLLYNTTEGFLLDLFESAVGKGFDTQTDSAAANLHPLVDALADGNVDRVVLIAHSQGTIIAAILLKALQEAMGPRDAVRRGPGAQMPSPERKAARKIAGTAKVDEQPHKARPAARRAQALRIEDLGKLEVYCFANCATSMGPIGPLGDGGPLVPWIESYGNEHDLVARLGVLAPPHGIGSARIEGDRWRRTGAWGHLFVAHYLIPMLRDLKRNGGYSMLDPLGPNRYAQPRLLAYLGGKNPPRPGAGRPPTG